jgi:hypothetical protein
MPITRRQCYDVYCYGRPYLSSEGFMLGDLGGDDSDWVVRLATPQTSVCGHLNASEWTVAGLFEQASAASFARLSLQFLAVAAPQSLVREAYDSAIEELHHAKLCFGLASSLAGHYWIFRGADRGFNLQRRCNRVDVGATFCSPP